MEPTTREDFSTSLLPKFSTIHPNESCPSYTKFVIVQLQRDNISKPKHVLLFCWFF